MCSVRVLIPIYMELEWIWTLTTKNRQVPKQVFGYRVRVPSMGTTWVRVRVWVRVWVPGYGYRYECWYPGTSFMGTGTRFGTRVRVVQKLGVGTGLGTGTGTTTLDIGHQIIFQIII